MTLPGVDVASFQDAPGRWMPLAGKISWAAVKVSELSSAGSYVDPDALPDLAALKARRLGRVAYMFGHPAMSASASVGLFLSTVEPVLTADDAVALDLEVTDGLSSAAVAQWGRNVLTMLEQRTHRAPLIYTYRDFALAGNCEGMGGRHLWIADPGSPAGKPRVPAPWVTWAVHQYKTAPLDRDVAAYDSLGAMRATLGRRSPKPKPASREDPVQLNTGPGAVTPIAFRNGESLVRFFPGSGDQTELSVEFNGHPAESVTLTGGAGSVAIPEGADGCRVIREATGATVAVSAVTE